MDGIFLDLYQGTQIAAANAAAHRATDKLSELQDQIADLHRKIGKLCLINAAMWDIIKEQHNFPDAELLSRMLERDAADGQIDGKLGAVTKTCVSCQKPLHPKHAQCLYCGQTHSAPKPFHL